MTHVLIVIAYMSGYANGATIVTQEFADGQRCVAAAEMIMQQQKAWNVGDKLRPFCVPK